MDVPNAAPATTTPAAPTGLTPRNNLSEKIGETAGWGPTNGDIEVRFTIRWHHRRPSMHDPYAQKPAHGHFVKVDVRIETAVNMPEEYRFQCLSADYWSAIGPDGVTQPDVGSSAACSCVDPDKTGLPLQLAPASKYRGSVVLDSVSRI